MQIKKWLLATLVLSLAALAFYELALAMRIARMRYSNPSTTALIDQRTSEAMAAGEQPKRDQIWVPYSKISPNLIRAVLAGEDSRFFDHSGFDWDEMQKALEEDWQKMKFERGASTISQQLAKNLFLSTSKNPLRKLQEALLTWEMERLLGKRRILELYLNEIEWGDGIYGAEAASRHYFDTPASALTPDQAAFLSAIIPNPRVTYNPALHKRRVDHRRLLVEKLMRHVVIPRELS
ncbi:MAG TPA: monofunctional biosynthetic peptidoglycan transglycosylase [Blastocatellia bacterium]